MSGGNRLATLSDGRRYENQRPLIHQLKKLRRLNKELARRTKGSKNWLKTKDRLGRVHYEIACMRADWLHKLTTQIAETAGIVAIEDLHVKGLIRNRCLSRSFSDAAVGKLLDLLESKVPRQGGMLLKVDRFFPSSQLCHSCGARKDDLQLSDRLFVCPNPDCGYTGDRDENAADNLILEALRVFGLNVNMPSGVVATTRRKTAWGLGVRPKQHSVCCQASGDEPGTTKAHLESLSSTFDVAERESPCGESEGLELSHLFVSTQPYMQRHSDDLMDGSC